MITNWMRKLISRMKDGEYHTAKELADFMEVSEKTTRIRLKDLEYELRPCAQIESKTRYGYRLVITDVRKFSEFIRTQDKRFQIPSNTEERVSYLLLRLVNSDDYLKIDDLADELYISRNTISIDLKRVEQTLMDYNLSLERRPAYGCRLAGKETDRRRLLVYIKDCIQEEIPDTENRIQEIIGTEFKKIVDKYQLDFVESNFQNIVLHLYISYRRLQAGYALEDKISDELEIDEHTYGIVKELTDRLGEILHVCYTEAETRYIALHFLGKQSLHHNGFSGNLVVSGEIIATVDEMLNEVYEMFKLDFRQNLELRLRLYEHLVPLEIRLRYGLRLKNPLLAYVQADYPFPFMIADCACKVLNRKYRKELSADEIAYIAILFALEMEYFETKSKKKKILLVCNSGKVTAQLIAVRYQKEFSSYIEVIDVCDLTTLKEKKLENWDVIFTTVPIRFSVPLPVINVSLSLNDADMENVRTALRKQSYDYLDYYYQEDLFFTDIVGITKEQVIWDICEATGEIVALPDGFYESVLKREEFMSTAYGHKCALLHPLHLSTDFSFVSVAVLDKPVEWWADMQGNPQEVQVVFLVSLAEDELYYIKEFYEDITELVFRENQVERLIREPSLETLKEIYHEKN